MPAKISSGGVSVDDVERRLPKGFFVRRGHVMEAFGLTSDEMTALVPDVFKPVHLPPNKQRKRKKSRAVFVRTQVVAVARKWEGAP
ncbi:MAG TPA: hypothetical protein VEB22_03750 [Phycisphaerales bacterium]|nr:hypothetical protein [Phycisphaerales bacterium]